MSSSNPPAPSPLEILRQSLAQIVVGQDKVIEQLLIALVAGGHVLIEGVPGTAKTLLVKAIARLIQADFRRVQLTPDILPSDILGTSIFDLNTRQFAFQQGPIFTEVLLADEINRTPPKTQAALLEAMEEQQATVEGKSLPLPELFWVAATQNPLEFEGTYPLPEAQLDRFLFQIVVDYPEEAAERQMLINIRQGFQAKREDLERIKPRVTVTQVLQMRQAARTVQIADPVIDYILALTRRTRQHPDLALGASPRAAGAWLATARSHAWLNGRTYVTPDDVKAVAVPLLRHRLILRPEARIDGVRVESAIAAILKQVAVPR